jgi:hypothetical protein
MGNWNTFGRFCGSAPHLEDPHQGGAIKQAKRLKKPDQEHPDTGVYRLLLNA